VTKDFQFLDSPSNWGTDIFSAANFSWGTSMARIVAARFFPIQRLRKRLRSLLDQRSGRSGFAAYRRIYSMARRHPIKVTEPLVLISQVKRSGGTLLSQLFDGHEECYAHPFELSIGKPKHIWPVLDLSQPPKVIFESLFEPQMATLFSNGYRKGPHSKRHLFLYLLPLQREIFIESLDGLKNLTERQVYDAYFSSYFSAWLNYQSRRSNKKVITAFVPKLHAYPKSVAKFFSVYPEGRLISVLRNPHSWYASQHNNPKKSTRRTLAEEIKNWSRNAEAICKNKRIYADRCLVVKFEDLILNTEQSLRVIANYLGIKFEPVLLIPTFNSHIVAANSSFDVNTPGIIRDSVCRRSVLTPEEITYITKVAEPLYQKAVECTVSVN